MENPNFHSIIVLVEEKRGDVQFGEGGCHSDVFTRIVQKITFLMTYSFFYSPEELLQAYDAYVKLVQAIPGLQSPESLDELNRQLDNIIPNNL